MFAESFFLHIIDEKTIFLIILVSSCVGPVYLFIENTDFFVLWVKGGVSFNCSILTELELGLVVYSFV